MPLENYSQWALRTKAEPQYGRGGVLVQVPVAPSGPRFSRPEQAPGWTTGMEDPVAERAMVKSMLAWIDAVVMPFRVRLTAPAQVILDKELLKLMHVGKGKSYLEMAAAADGFCQSIDENALLSGTTLLKPSELKRRYPELFSGGQGLRLDYAVPPGGGFLAATSPVDAMHLFGRCAGKPNGPVAPKSRMRVHDESRRMFEAGAPGSAWTGICQMGHRSGIDSDIVYLVPNAAVGSHLGFEHNHATRQEIKPGEHGLQGNTSHSHACGMIEMRMGGFEVGGGLWNTRPPTDWVDAQSAGMLWGFSVVRAFNSLGHLYAWTSVSTNRFGGSKYYADDGSKDASPTQDEFAAMKLSEQRRWRKGDKYYTGVSVYGGDTDVALDWAISIWKATKDLA